jgi:hypothetical protein
VASSPFHIALLSSKNLQFYYATRTLTSA